ncbi:substrate-binding domain-containing protein [Devosia sp.]|uniref:LacI family DNA-binding transcriptional regulator n=1 Tax=Devosia sp. TaxID=1871048 RepID=UPI002AFDCF09|nr:substrate-binding domain-containing protein [Devosia sp.]
MSKPKTKTRKASVSADKVAELAGVSRSAVSRAFTDGASVSPETRAKVLAAAAQLGYHVNHLARGLLWHRTGIVCLIVAEMQAPFQASMVEVITRRLQAIGKVVMVLNTSGQADSVESALRQTLNYRADATVFISGTPPASLVNTCLENGQRVILINRADPIVGPEFISVENETAALEACLMLKRAGCQRVAVVSSTAGTPGLASRERTFLEAAAENGLEACVSRAGPTGYKTGADSARQLLATSRRPEGVFCVTDLLALGFMDVARLEFRMSIPQDLCVIGFDDIPESNWLGYELTTFRQPLQGIADQIASIVEKEDGEPGAPAILPTQVVWRKTVRP